MSRTLNPELLGSDSSVTGGAPIVGLDYIVESGNQRTMAIRQAMNQGTSEGYTTWLREHAADFGLDPAGITDRTVLVRVRDTEVDRAEFACQANESVTAQMSPAELAQSDAAQMSEDVLALFQQTENGEIDTGANRPFLKAFLQSIIPESQQGAYTQENGRLSKQGIDRIRNALFQRAYGSTRLTTAFSEATDETSRNVFTALMNAAPHMAAVSDAIQRGTMYAVQIADDVAKAAELIRQVRSEGGTLDDRLNQFSIFGDVDPVVADFARMMDEYKRSGKNMTRALNDVLDTIENLGAPNQEMLPGFEIPAPDKQALVEASLERTQERIAAERAGAVEGQIGLPGMDAQAFVGQSETRTPSLADSLTEAETIPEKAQVVYNAASPVQEQLNTMMREVTNELDLSEEYQDVTQKSLKSIIDKVTRKTESGEDYDVMRMKDHTRTKITLDDFSQIPDVLDALDKRNIPYQTEAVGPTDWGYKGFHVTWRNADGVSSELQLTRPDAWKTKLWSDAIYDKWRNVTDVMSLSLEDREQYIKQKAESNERWNQLGLPDFSKYVRSSSAVRTREFQSSSNETGLVGSTQAPFTNSRTNTLGSDENFNTRPDSVSTGGKNSLMGSSPSAGIIQQESAGGNTRTGLNNDVQAFQGTGQQAQRPIQPVQVPTGKPKHSPQQIASGLAKSLNIGNLIGTRKMNGMPANVQGYFEKHAEYIAVRSKNAGDYVTTMHELGHAIGKRLGMTGTQDMITAMQQNAAASGIDLSKYTPDQLQDEAYAEFFWRYMEDEDLARQFAGDAFVDDFERQMQNAGIDRMVHRSAGELRQYVNATANDRIAALVHDKSEKRKTPLGYDLHEATRTFHMGRIHLWRAISLA